MQQPPALPAIACTIGKVLCLLAYVIGVWCLVQTNDSALTETGWWILGFLLISHIVELFIYRPFLQQVQATAADYLQVFVFGIFHSATLLPTIDA